MAANRELNLMPYPQQVQLLSGRIAIDANFSMLLKGYRCKTVMKKLKGTLERLYRQTGVPMLHWQASSQQSATLVVDIASAPPSDVPNLGWDESYHLHAAEGQVVIRAPQPVGALHALETFLQLIESDALGYYLPALSITDAPRFGWRGVTYDTARRYIELPVILRQLDAMAAAKLNVFHWHFWDDQGIRIQFESYPKLWQQSADGYAYSKAEVSQVIEYARALGIRVIPEISLPGHASAVAHAYPHLMSGPSGQTYPQQRGWGVFAPLMDPTNPELLSFLASIFHEVVALFPDQYVHIGGDEPEYQQWRDNPRIQRFIQEHQLDGERGLQSYLNTQVESMLAAHGRKVIGWDEVWHRDLPTSVVIQSWQGHDSIGRAAKQGYQGILSTGYYLDQPQPTSYHYRNDPMPQGLTVDDQLTANDKFVCYTWHKPRPKGEALSGNLIIIESAQGQVRAFSDYHGRSRQAVTVLEYLPGERFRGHLDTFMSYTEFHYQFAGEQLANGSYQRIGNVRYPVTGALSASSDWPQNTLPEAKGGYPAELSEKERTLILGGEITIWGELVDSMTIESRLWPRSFAIAERFWSSVEQCDEQSMYRRMQIIDTWSQLSLGLRHQADAQLGLMRLAMGSDSTPLAVLAQYTEPGQYYARHWQKWQATPTCGERYNQYERLNRFVDALAVESLAVYQMEQLLRDMDFGQRAECQVILASLTSHYQTAKWAATQSLELLARSAPGAQSVPLAQATIEVADLALILLEKFSENVTISAEQYHAYQAVLNEKAVLFDEAIVALVRPTEQLLHKFTH
ncbi:beta-N-acetylhexosaminidase [Vibrio navarrensis]|uniref:beta-N-acetylhexosaminidase n=1 Tax=Vibrio navarrensis TaxID=29495 RepID=UPI001D052F9B|nr:beta-N-acetylhexosaminidase [Vibrio navarrensis]